MCPSPRCLVLSTRTLQVSPNLQLSPSVAPLTVACKVAAQHGLSTGSGPASASASGGLLLPMQELPAGS